MYIHFLIHFLIFHFDQYLFFQLDHFLGELEEIFDTTLNSTFSSKTKQIKLNNDNKIKNNRNTAQIDNFILRKPNGKNDRGWQVLTASQCLWGCETSPIFTP